VCVRSRRVVATPYPVGALCPQIQKLKYKEKSGQLEGPGRKKLQEVRVHHARCVRWLLFHAAHVHGVECKTPTPQPPSLHPAVLCCSCKTYYPVWWLHGAMRCPQCPPSLRDPPPRSLGALGARSARMEPTPLPQLPALVLARLQTLGQVVLVA
jgi:hypothetical protein